MEHWYERVFHDIMISGQFELSIHKHVTYLAGYMDAVGRAITTDSELFALTARDAKEILDGDILAGIEVRAQLLIENWSKEFGSLVDDLLGMDQCNSLGFYLIDYICWFNEFTQNAECFKLDCEPLEPGTINQAIYMLKLEDQQKVVLLAQRLEKAHTEPSQSPPDASAD